MKLFVGLGNPGAKYAANRHNIGFMALEAIARDHGFGGWKKAHQGLISEGKLAGEKVVLLKPETFMNLSGQSVRAAADFWKLAPDAITVFHDELDLAPGKIKHKTGGGHAGHNGLRSIHGHIGENYHRLRLGIGHPGHKDAVAHYVLHDFSKADQSWLLPLLDAIGTAAPDLAQGEAAKFLGKVALRLQPAKKAPEPPRAPAAPPPSRPAAPAEAPDPAAKGVFARLKDHFR